MLAAKRRSAVGWNPAGGQPEMGGLPAEPLRATRRNFTVYNLARSLWTDMH